MSKSLYTTIIEETAPTTTTVGVVGQLYLDSTTKILYQCVAINIEDLTYEWKQIGGGSGKYLHYVMIRGGSGNTDLTIMVGIINDVSTAYNTYRDFMTDAWVFGGSKDQGRLLFFTGNNNYFYFSITNVKIRGSNPETCGIGYEYENMKIGISESNGVATLSQVKSGSASSSGIGNVSYFNDFVIEL